jgi:hypothetical protein
VILIVALFQGYMAEHSLLQRATTQSVGDNSGLAVSPSFGSRCKITPTRYGVTL